MIRSVPKNFIFPVDFKENNGVKESLGFSRAWEESSKGNIKQKDKKWNLLKAEEKPE